MPDISITEHGEDVQATLDAVALAGGGVALVPEGSFEWMGTLTIPPRVILRGSGDGSVLRWNVPPDIDDDPIAEPVAISFREGAFNVSHRGGLESLQILRDIPAGAPPPRAVGIGVDLTSAHFLRLRNLQIWDFAVGVCLSDGVTPFAAYNHLSDFEINRCRVGVRAWEHCNQCTVREGRIHFCRNPQWPAEPGSEPAIAVDVRGAQALAIDHVAIEDFDLGVRITGFTRVALNSVYYEADVPCPDPDDIPAGEPPCVESAHGIWMDVRPDPGSVVRMESSRGAEGSVRTLGIGGSLEDAIVSDDAVYLASAGTRLGAKRHYAAAAERNLVENGDFHRAAGVSFATIPGWFALNNPTLLENTGEGTHVTGGRSYDVIRTGSANDGIGISFTVPETSDYVTVMVRFQNIDSTAPLFRVDSGANPALFSDPRPADPDDWRVAAITVEVDHDQPPEDLGVVRVLLAADQGPRNGTRIRIDEVWAVIGATAAPPRAHAHRIEYLEAPVRVATRTNAAATTAFFQTDLGGLPGLGRAPRGAIGAVLWLRGQTMVGGAAAGTVRTTVVAPFVQAVPRGPQYALNIFAERSVHDRQIVLRSMSFRDGIRFFGGDTTPTSYSIDVVGWILPS